MAIELPDTESITEKNLLTVLKQHNKFIQELADSRGNTEMMLLDGIKGVNDRLDSIKNEMKQTRGETSNRLDSIEKKMDKGFKELRTEFKSEMKQTREETVDLLKQIAENTKK